MNYSSNRIEVYKTEEFGRWLTTLMDRDAKARIQARIDRISLGQFGDAKTVGKGVSELRIFKGPGYRVYFTMQRSMVVILLTGGDKSTQTKDIRKAQKLVGQLEMQS